MTEIKIDEVVAKFVAGVEAEKPELVASLATTISKLSGRLGAKKVIDGWQRI